MPGTPRAPRQDDVEPHDDSMRWRVRSRRARVDPHLVDLVAYGGNGRCSCKDFQTRMEPILRKGLRPEDAVEAGVLEVRGYMAGPWEACRCYHIYRARGALADAFVETYGAAQAAQAAGARR